MKKATFLIVWSLMAIFFTQTSYSFEMPRRTHFKVNDYAGVIDQQTKDYLENYLKEFKKRHRKIEIIVTTLPSLEGMPFDLFMREYAYKWRRIWPFDNEHRVHFVVIVNDRKTRFGVGYALENVLSKPIIKKLVDEVVVPEFKQNHYSEGVRKGVEFIVNLLDQHPD